MLLTYKYRLYPTVAQAATLNAQIDEACRLYNAALQERMDAWRLQRKSVSFYEQSDQIKDIRAAGDIAIPNFKIALDVLHRVDRTFQAFFRRVKMGENPGYPRFRSVRRYDSITFMFNGPKRWLDGSRVNLHGVGGVRLKLHRPIDGEIRTVTVKRSAGRWFVCFACRVAAESLPASTEAVGVDVGLASFATLHDGLAVANPRYLAAGQKALRVAHRRVARRKLGGSGRRKAVRILQRAYEHTKNQRRDFHHKVARQLVNKYGLIAVEDLNVKGLASGILAKPVHDAGWGDFLRILKAKAENAGRLLVAVNPAGTSQRCSGCGQTVPKKLSDRVHACPDCGVVLGRDHNAALNILRAGMALAESTRPDVRVSVSAVAELHPRSTRGGER